MIETLQSLRGSSICIVDSGPVPDDTTTARRVLRPDWLARPGPARYNRRLEARRSVLLDDWVAADWQTRDLPQALFDFQPQRKIYSVS